MSQGALSVPRYRRPAPSTLERAAISAVKAADWLTPTDNGAVWLLRDVLMNLDLVRRQGAFDGVPAASPRDLAELAGRALQLYRELGLTPAARHRLGLWDETVDDAFGQLIELGAKTGSAAE